MTLRTTILVFSGLPLLVAQTRPAAPQTLYLGKVRTFADTLLANGIDRYGSKSTPAWVSMLDIKTRRIPESKDPNWQRSYDAEDYMRNARGSNLYRDIATIHTFRELSALTGDPRYKQAADAYMTWFMKTCASPTTGLFAWGEHMFYNVVREDIEANRHELERQLPPWEELWRLNPEAVRREIEGLYTYHIHDKETFNFDRHGNFYTGKFDDPQVRGPYTKHSGLYAYSFLFLYTKTGEQKHLDWALKAGQMFWKVRNPQTNLIGGAWAPVQSGPTNLPGHLSWYLLHAYRLDRRQTVLRDVAAGLAKAYMQASWDPVARRYHRDVNVADAKPLPGYLSPWSDGQGESGMFGQAALMAYQETGDAEFLEFARRYAQAALEDPISSGIHPETYGKSLEFLLDMFEATHEPAYLKAVRRFAAKACETLFENGLIKETPDGYIYNASSGAGDLAHALLRAAKMESAAGIPASDEDRFPALSSWSFPKLVQSGQTVSISLKPGPLPKGAEVVLIADAGQEIRPSSSAQGMYRFELPAYNEGGAHHFAARCRVAGAMPWQGWSDRQTIWTSERAAFPNIVIGGQPAPGVEKLAAAAITGKQAPNALPWLFRLPAAAPRSEVSVRLTPEEIDPYLPNSLKLYRQANNAWLPVPTKVDLGARSLSAQAAPGLYAIGGEPRLNWRLPTDGALLISPVVADFQQDGKSLQIALATNDIDRSLHLLRPDGTSLWRFPAKGALGTPVLVRTSGQPAIAFASLDTLYLVNAQGKQVWSHQFESRVLPPAFTQGRLYVATAGGELLVLDAAGAVQWKHVLGAGVVTAPVVADLLGDGSRVILVGGADAKLHAIVENKGELWAADARGPRFLPPAVGDIDGDGKPEVVFAAKSVSTAHEVAALNAKGLRLWAHEAHREGEWAPVLADMQGLGYKQVIIETELLPWPKCELTILDRDGRRLRGIPIQSRVTLIPVATDLDADGKLDLVFPCNEDRRMHAVANSGTDLWSFAPKSLNYTGAKMKGGGSPAIADIDGDGRLELVVGDDETVLNCIRTETRLPPRTIVIGEFRHSGAHTGN
ncbi:FG-GAP-like repeat-containing protein [uncultured Paludibaculum sp.]|uniref:FG-GAP-like repeat-containing protein n=1 Tax=uncultured Paludibaculum sp. TaxID=1765020 RepID=UPI002AAA8292|nr:PQQ-binding-like beta-propeller repeat protein [uncultured Paludibaculum sp.]